MSRHILVTVGTSLLTNRDDRPWGGWRHGRDFPPEADVDRWLRDAKPAAASAEIHTLHRLEVGSEDVLFLFCSQSPDGRFCAEALRRYYQGLKIRSEVQAISGFTGESRTFSEGLKNMIDLVLKRIGELENRATQVILAATGGYKPESAFLTLLGALAGVDVVYLHERHQELVRIPRLPLHWNEDVVHGNREFFEWIDEEPRPTEEVEARLKGHPELRFLTTPAEDGNTYLTVAGTLLWRAASKSRPRVEWPPADARPPAEKNGLSGIEHERPKGWESFVRRLCSIDCVRWVRFDPKAGGGARVRIADPEQGHIFVFYRHGDQALPLRVETTARGEAQTQLVAEYLGNFK
jgi:putative CRISPR-associated protein (TIGR02619 family)